MFTSLRQAADKIQPQDSQGGMSLSSVRAAAEHLKNYGRNGDTQLIHISNQELEDLKKSGKITRNPHTGLPEAFSVGGVAGRLFGSVGGGSAAERTNTADTLANTMNDPHRNSSFQAYNADLANPSGYFQNNPYAKSALDAANNLISSQSAKSGNPTNVESNIIPQVMQAIGSNYNNLLQTEQVGAGLNQGAGYSGVAGNTPFGIGQQQESSLMSGMGSAAGAAAALMFA